MIDLRLTPFDYVLFAATFVSAVLAARKGRAFFTEGLKQGSRMAIVLMPAIILGLLAAGFLGEALPNEALAHIVGRESGLFGIVLATIAGAFTPGGPILTFPLVIALVSAGAGAPQMVAFMTAWSTLAFNRVLVYELPVMGVEFVRRRLLVSFLIPVAVGLIYLAGGELLPGIFGAVKVLQPR